jgi:hypothetical protein
VDAPQVVKDVQGVASLEQFGLDPLGGVGRTIGGWLASNPLRDISDIARVASLGIGFLINPQSWLRVGEAVAGVVLIGGGILILVWSTDAGKQVGGTLGQAAKAVAA